MKEVFGAVLSVKDNVSGVMKQAKESTRGYRGEVEKTKKELEKLDKKKIREKELKIKNSEAYKAIEGVKKKLQPLAKKTIEIQAKTEHAVDKVKKVKSQLDKIKSTKVVQLVVKGGQKADRNGSGAWCLYDSGRCGRDAGSVLPEPDAKCWHATGWGCAGQAAGDVEATQTGIH